MDQRDEMLKTAAEMRYWQKEYFRRRNQTALRCAQQLERKFDEKLAAYQNGQQQLFPDERTQ